MAKLISCAGKNCILAWMSPKVTGSYLLTGPSKAKSVTSTCKNAEFYPRKNNVPISGSRISTKGERSAN